jgi:hypothetical protein
MGSVFAGQFMVAHSQLRLLREAVIGIDEERAGEEIYGSYRTRNVPGWFWSRLSWFAEKGRRKGYVYQSDVLTSFAPAPISTDLESRD